MYVKFDSPVNGNHRNSQEQIANELGICLYDCTTTSKGPNWLRVNFTAIKGTTDPIYMHRGRLNWDAWWEIIKHEFEKGAIQVVTSYGSWTSYDEFREWALCEKARKES